MRFILLVIGAWLLYKLIFDLIIPIYRSTKIVRSGFRKMQDQMQQHMNQQTSQSNYSPDSSPSSSRPGNKDDDYIEFEEVK
jgi:hypothetical protein